MPQFFIWLKRELLSRQKICIEDISPKLLSRLKAHEKEINEYTQNTNHWTVKYEEKNGSRPGKFQVVGGTLPLYYGMDGEEGIYADSAFDLELMTAAPKMYEALLSISKNSCCGNCQEAKLVALNALKDLAE